MEWLIIVIVFFIGRFSKKTTVLSGDLRREEYYKSIASYFAYGIKEIHAIILHNQDNNSLVAKNHCNQLLCIKSDIEVPVKYRIEGKKY